MLTTLIAIFLLLILSAFFSGSETALTAASRPMMHLLAQKGDHRAALVNRLHEQKDRLIGAILLGNNLVNILASSLATSLLISLFGEAGVAYATLVMTLLVLVFSEILPKTYAIQNANRMALGIAPTITGLVALLGPVTATLQVVVRATLRLFRVNVDGADEASEDELRGAIALHDGEEDDVVEQERKMLDSILDLDDVEVGEIMTHRRSVLLIDAATRPADLVDQVLASPYTRLPIYSEEPDNVIGVLHAKALLRAVRAHGADLDDLDIVALANPPWFIPEATTLLDQLQAFRKRREHFALVIDEYGSLMGIVTLEDILEEIVGDISDEHDITVAGVRPQPDGSYLVQGTVTIRDLNRRYDWNLPDEEAATVAGLVLHESRRIPEVGQAFLFHGFRFEILRRQRHQITTLRVTPPAPDGEGADSAS
ncbi:MAG: HlyC/CorC family transporter [Rhodobacterales bacterium]|nr:HlyC/CorC family transporter [Rhodobacterales bacterium]